MRAWKVIFGTVGLLLAAQLGAAEMLKLTAYERSQGWWLLFDGQTMRDWQGFGQNNVPDNWQVVDGSLAGSGGPALSSAGEIKDFEMVFDWKVGAGGRAEVFYRAEVNAASPEESGPVMQLAGDGVVMGSNGGLTSPGREITLQPDVWYRAKITVFGYQVEHWINGERILSYLIDSPDWRTAVAGSRYKAFKDYGLLSAGRIVLAGKDVLFRNIKIRKL